MITTIPSVVPYAPVECVGPLQARLLDRVAAAGRPYWAVAPSGFLELRAVRRLAARDILCPLLGFPGVWTLTTYAHHCNWAVNR